MKYDQDDDHGAVEAYKPLHPYGRFSEGDIFVDLESPYLCASSYRLVDDVLLLDVKCPCAANKTAS